MPVSIENLGTKHCRFVLDQKDEHGLLMYCGEDKREKSSFCHCHHGLVWEKPVPYQKYVKDKDAKRLVCQ